MISSRFTQPWRRTIVRLGLLTLSPMLIVAIAADRASASTCYIPYNVYSVAAAKKYWVYGEGNDLRTRDVHGNGSRTTVDGHSYQWKNELWQGPRFHCPAGGSPCHYSYSEAVSRTTGWSINASITAAVTSGAGTQGGATGQGIITITPGYGQSSTVGWSSTYTIDVAPNQWVQPYMGTLYEHQWGRTLGAWVSPGREGTPCYGFGVVGYQADFHPGWLVSYWSADVRLYDFHSFYTWY